MFHLVYVSTATRPFTDADAAEVLQEARFFNETHGVTGMLVHADFGGFLQVLEGAQHDVEAAYARAVASSRHEALLRTPLIPVAERVFPDWSMGFERALPTQLVERVLQPLVDHRLITGDQVRAVLLQRWHLTASAAAMAG